MRSFTAVRRGCDPVEAVSVPYAPSPPLADFPPMIWNWLSANATPFEQNTLSRLANVRYMRAVGAYAISHSENGPFHRSYLSGSPPEEELATIKNIENTMMVMNAAYRASSCTQLFCSDSDPLSQNLLKLDMHPAAMTATIATASQCTNAYIRKFPSEEGNGVMDCLAASTVAVVANHNQLNRFDILP